MLTHPDFDPVAFSVGPLSVHWYGIMYLLAFATAWWLGIRLSRRPNSPLETRQVEDLIVYGALGVVLGGRMGYVFFYNFDAFLADPLWLFRVWEGGMSFHGGLLGVIAALWLYSRRIGASYYSILDFVAVVVPLGLGFGRLGNFIGQELWGRQTDVAWGMLFPNDPEQLVRHPSQLYQAFLEGVVLFTIVYWFARRPRPQLAVGAVFLIFYGLFRFAVEFFRQPDAHIPDLMFGWMTRGQLLTIPMVAIGLAVLIWAYTRGQAATAEVADKNITEGKASDETLTDKKADTKNVAKKAASKSTKAKKNRSKKTKGPQRA